MSLSCTNDELELKSGIGDYNVQKAAEEIEVAATMKADEMDH